MARSNIATQIGARIRARRESRGWSQARLAEAVELTPNYVGLLERGESLPTVQTLIDLARALATTPTQLMGDGPAQDEWIDQLNAVGESLPLELRPLALSVLKAIASSNVAAQSKRRSRRKP